MTSRQTCREGNPGCKKCDGTETVLIEGNEERCPKCKPDKFAAMAEKILEEHFTTTGDATTGYEDIMSAIVSALRAVDKEAYERGEKDEYKRLQPIHERNLKEAYENGLKSGHQDQARHIAEAEQRGLEKAAKLCNSKKVCGCGMRIADEIWRIGLDK